MSNTGYEIFEPEIIGEWFSVIKNQSVLVALLTWIIDKIRISLIAQNQNLILELIKVEYHGCYPAIGIKVNETTPDNFIDVLEIFTREILHRTSVYDFLEFLFANDIDWVKVTKKLLEE